MSILSNIQLLEFETVYSVIAALVFSAALMLITKFGRQQWLYASLVLASITPLVLSGFFLSGGNLGISDWDYYFSLHTTNRNTLLSYMELPHWNPYICGGTAGLADPEFRFFTPTFLLQLFSGIPTGFRLSIWLATSVGAVGILFLSRSLGLSIIPATAAATVYGFGSVNLLEIVEGHPNIFAAMWIPWIFWCWLSAYRTTSDDNRRRRIWEIITGIFLALTFFEGGIYLLMYTAIAFFGLLFLVKNPVRAARASLMSGAWSLGFAAVKLIPVLMWLSHTQDAAYASSAFTLPYLNEILLGRHLHGANVFPGQEVGWHEYGAYVGPVALILALIASSVLRNRRVIQALFVSGVFAFLLSSAGPLLRPAFDLIPFLPRSNIARLILFTVIPLALLCGFGFQILSRFRYSRVLSMILLFALSIDLFSLAYPLSKQAFVVPREVHPIPLAPYPIAYTNAEYKFRIGDNDHTRAYEAIVKGYGTMSYCSVLSPEPSVRLVSDEDDNGILVVKNETERGAFTLTQWTPNKVAALVTARRPMEVILNANYAKGWHVNGKKAEEINSRVGTHVAAGTHDITFQYRTPALGIGIALTFMTLIVALLTIRHAMISRHMKPHF